MAHIGQELAFGQIAGLRQIPGFDQISQQACAGGKGHHDGQPYIEQNCPKIRCNKERTR